MFASGSTATKNRQYDPRLHEEFQRSCGWAPFEASRRGRHRRDRQARRRYPQVPPRLTPPVVLVRRSRLGQIRKEFAAVEAAARRASAPKVDDLTRRIPRRPTAGPPKPRSGRSDVHVRPPDRCRSSMSGTLPEPVRRRRTLTSGRSPTSPRSFDNTKKAGSACGS